MIEQTFEGCGVRFRVSVPSVLWDDDRLGLRAAIENELLRGHRSHYEDLDIRGRVGCRFTIFLAKRPQALARPEPGPIDATFDFKHESIRFEATMDVYSQVREVQVFPQGTEDRRILADLAKERLQQQIEDLEDWAGA